MHCTNPDPEVFDPAAQSLSERIGTCFAPYLAVAKLNALAARVACRAKPKPDPKDELWELI